MIVGASPETDYHILKLTEGMYQKYSLKRVFYSAYIPVAEDTRLPALDTKPPLLREHRLYQADWLLRFYQFEADEILDQDNPNFNPYLDPKCNWAVQHYGLFPVDVNRAPFEMLLRVPGIGPKSAAHLARPQAGGAGAGRAQAHGGGAQAGPVFPHLRRQVPGGPAGLPRRGAPPPGGPGAAHAGPGRAGAALPLRADGLGGGHGLDTGFLCL